MLRRILQTAEIRVNSLHHQAVKQPGRFVVSAVAPDGVTEGIELPGHLFALGVQWHPEWLADDYRHGQAIFEALLVAAQKKERRLTPNFCQMITIIFEKCLHFFGIVLS